MKLNWESIYTGFSQKKKLANFTIYQDTQARPRYASNFMLVDGQQSVEDFQKQEVIYKAELASKQLEHLQMYFPFNQPISVALQQYLKVSGYEVDMEEVYCVDPQFYLTQNLRENTAIRVEFVTTETLEDFIAFNYEDCLKFGEEFASFMRDIFIPKQFAAETTKLIIALLGNRVVGTVFLHDFGTHFELDNFTVATAFQRKDIGTTIQKYIMQYVGDTQVQLIASGSDTPRLMYQKQGYILQAFYYFASRPLLNED